MPTPIANARRAQATALRAQADALDAEATALDEVSTGDDWIPLPARDLIPGFGIRGRVVVDAARRGELELLRAGRKPVVRRTELLRWLGDRRVAARAPTGPTDEGDDYLRLVEGRAR